MIQLKYPLILASESPRRKMLLEEAGFSFTVFPVKVSETLKKNLNINEGLIAIAEEKAYAAYKSYKALNSHDFLVLAADTMVIREGHALGKPKNSTEALDILSSLSGRQHEVKTAIYFFESKNKLSATAVVTTEVYFRLISRQEILDYIQTGEPMDKAGAYGIQGLGGRFVEKIQGPYDNVVGLPVEKVQQLLTENKWLKN